MNAEKWTEASIGRAVSKGLFKASTLVVPCCGWTGHECDLLVVTKDLRIIDVEIKISRADLKADLAKDKWWKHRPWSRRAKFTDDAAKTRVDWPPKVWKHYYCMPADIWDDNLLPHIPATSGVLLLERTAGALGVAFRSIRACKPNRDAQRINASDAVDIARLPNLRMWDGLHREARRTP